MIFCGVCTQVKAYIGDASLSISTPGKRKFCLTTVGIEPVTFSLLVVVLYGHLSAGSDVMLFALPTSYSASLIALLS